jgi:hypothetical protein
MVKEFTDLFKSGPKPQELTLEALAAPAPTPSSRKKKGSNGTSVQRRSGNGCLSGSSAMRMWIFSD